MIHFVDYTLTYTYTGRMKVSAITAQSARRSIEEMNPNDLKALAGEAQTELSTSVSTLGEEIQIDFFQEEASP